MQPTMCRSCTQWPCLSQCIAGYGPAVPSSRANPSRMVSQPPSKVSGLLYGLGLGGFIDGIVLITLWVNVITSLSQYGGSSRVVGAFKALRALRLLNVSDSARETFHAVIILGGWKVISVRCTSTCLLKCI